MSQPETPTPRRRGRGQAVGLLAGGVVAGAVLAGTIGAYAVGTSAPAASAAASSSTSVPAGPGRDGSTPVRSDEKSVTAAQAATLKAAALKAVPGGTVYRIETDAGDGTYEAHMTKSDGTAVTVKFDKNLAVLKVEDGMGTGDPAPTGAPRGGGASTSG